MWLLVTQPFVVTIKQKAPQLEKKCKPQYHVRENWRKAVAVIL
jgi:hypothetical protein